MASDEKGTLYAGTLNSKQATKRGQSFPSLEPSCRLTRTPRFPRAELRPGQEKVGDNLPVCMSRGKEAQILNWTCCEGKSSVFGIE